MFIICNTKSLSQNSLREWEPFHGFKGFKPLLQGIIARGELVRSDLPNASF